MRPRYVSPTISCDLSQMEGLHISLDLFSSALGITKSSIIRHAVRDYIERTLETDVRAKEKFDRLKAQDEEVEQQRIQKSHLRVVK